MNHIENDIADTVDHIQPERHQPAEVAQEDIAALFARLSPQDVEHFYQSYQHWYSQVRIQTLHNEIAELKQTIAYNAALMDQYHPSSIAQSILGRLQANGVNDVELLDRMLERGDDWLDHTMQLLEQCEHLDIIHDNYVEWCEHALEGAYDWIASMHEEEENASAIISSSEVFDEFTEQLLLQKLLSEEEEVTQTPEIVEETDSETPHAETSSVEISATEGPALALELEAEPLDAREFEEYAIDHIVPIAMSDNVEVSGGIEEAHVDVTTQQAFHAPTRSPNITRPLPETLEARAIPEEVEGSAIEGQVNEDEESVAGEATNSETIEISESATSTENEITEAQNNAIDLVETDEEASLTETPIEAEALSESTTQAIQLAPDEEPETTPVAEVADITQDDDVEVEPATQTIAPVEENFNETIVEEETPEHEPLEEAKDEEEAIEYDRDNPPFGEHSGSASPAVPIASDEDTIAIPKISFPTVRVTPLPSIVRAETQPTISAITPDKAPDLVEDDISSVIEADTRTNLPAVDFQDQTQISSEEQATTAPIPTQSAASYADTNKQAAILHVSAPIWREPEEYLNIGSGHAGESLPQTPLPVLQETRPGFFHRLWLWFLRWLKG